MIHDNQYMEKKKKKMLSVSVHHKGTTKSHGGNERKEAKRPTRKCQHWGQLLPTKFSRQRKWYLSNSYISIGFSGRGPNFEVSFTLKSVIRPKMEKSGRERDIRIYYTELHEHRISFKICDINNQTRFSQPQQILA